MSWFSSLFKQKEIIKESLFDSVDSAFDETDKLFDDIFGKDELFGKAFKSRVSIDIGLSKQNFEDMVQSTTLPWHHPKLLSKLKEAFNLPPNANLIGLKITANGIEACLGDPK